MDSNEPVVCFSNSGEIDLAAVTTLGVSVKPQAGAIGYFGTGLKYSIAVLLREQQAVSIFSGEQEYVFELRARRIRGEDFQIIHMRRAQAPPIEAESLHFTTAYGKNWTLENVYRELWSNNQDEPERSISLREPPFAWLQGSAGFTHILVRGERFAEVHRNRWGFLLNPERKLLDKGADFEVYLGQSTSIFYRGIAAHKLSKPSRFTYNITRDHTLTEDRTLQHGSYFFDGWLKSFVLHDAEEELCRDMLSTGENNHEGTIYYTSLESAGPTFKSVMKAAIESNLPGLNSTAEEVFYALERNVKLEWKKYDMIRGEEDTLNNALTTIDRWGFSYAHFGFAVEVVEECGEGRLACADMKRTATLSRECLADPDLLHHALIEEFVHLRDKVQDNTRQMQNVLFREIVRLGYARDAQEHGHYTSGDMIMPAEELQQPVPQTPPPDDADLIPF